MYKKKSQVFIVLLINIFITFGFIGCTKKNLPISENKTSPSQQSEDIIISDAKSEEEILEPTEEVIEPNENNKVPVQPIPESSDYLSKLSNEKFGWGLVPKINGSLPDIPDNWKILLNKYDGYYHGNTSLKEVYLTFDEGYENGYTPQILDILKEYDVKAAFFITGYYLDKNEVLVERMLNEGHIVGNHTVNHPSMPSLSVDEMKTEVLELSNKYENITGRKMNYFRPPMGEFSERSLALIQNLGYKSIFWSIALRDWEPLPGGTEESYNTVISRLHNSAIILLHAVSKDDTLALPEIIATIKEKGYEFKSLEELKK